MTRRIVTAVALLVAAAIAATAALASSPPIGPLPAGPVTTITTDHGQLVAVALPHRSGGRVWRIARAFDGTIIREVSEIDVGSNVVIVFQTRRAGTVTLTYALTKGESAKALEARRFQVKIR